MNRIILTLAVAALASPAAAQTLPTKPADLEALALQLEQSPASSTMNSKLLSLLREPAKTLEGRTLPTTAAQYTTNVETAWKLLPTGWLPAVTRQNPPSSGGVACTALLSNWVNAPDPKPGLRMETFAWGKGTCAAVTSAAIARAWAWKLRQAGR